MSSILPWIVLLAPLCSAACITLFALRWKALSSFISIMAVLLSFICSCLVFSRADISSPQFGWIDVAGALNVPFGLTQDQLSKMMLVLVSGVGAVIHIYSLGYMRDDEGKSRYFGALSLFMFAMLGIVVANNFVMLFMFWELVGFTSYVLIGHWFYRDAAAAAAKKAVSTTRIGDFGFMIGILMLWMATGSIVFAEITPRMSMLTSHPTFLTVVALLIFCGAVGKSAQFPLHVWLPDAMEGPTPISALIHAATMVAAGVYMLVRVAFVIQTSQTALLVIAWIGTITAVLAALIGCPPFSGFFSKDAILALAYQRNVPIFAVGLFTAFLTAFYVIRLLVIVFFGKPRSEVARESRESPAVMTGPLIVLALLATLGGFAFFARRFLALPIEKEVAVFVPAVAIVALILGSGLAIVLYRNRASEPLDLQLLRHKFYFDEFYRWLIYWTQELRAG